MSRRAVFKRSVGVVNLSEASWGGTRFTTGGLLQRGLAHFSRNLKKKAHSSKTLREERKGFSLVSTGNADARDKLSELSALS